LFQIYFAHNSFVSLIRKQMSTMGRIELSETPDLLLLKLALFIRWKSSTLKNSSKSNVMAIMGQIILSVVFSILNRSRAKLMKISKLGI